MATVRVVAIAGGVVALGGLAARAMRRSSADPSAPPITAPRESAVDVASDPAFVGRPSRTARNAVAALRGITTVTDVLGLDFGTQIAPLMASAHPPSWLMSGLHVRRDNFQGWPVYILTSTSAGPHHHQVVALHGGAYVVEPTINHWSAYAAIARRTHSAVVVPIYPLASTPQGRATVVIPAIADFLTAQILRYGADNVAVYGDSAGGGMALAAAQTLVEAGRATPARMVLISPWLDITMSDPAIDRIDDPVLRTASLRKAGQQWAAGLAPTDPRVSPLYGSLAGLPPTTVYCGNLDLLAADALRLRQKSDVTPDSSFTFVLRNGAIHDWAMGGVLATPESAAVQHHIHRQLGLQSEER